METEKTTSAGKSGNAKNKDSKTKNGAKRAAEVLGAAAVGSASTMAATADWNGEDDEKVHASSAHNQPGKEEAVEAEVEETETTQPEEVVFDPNDIVIDESELFDEIVVADYVEPEPVAEPEPIIDITDEDLFSADIIDNNFNPDEIVIDEEWISGDTELADSDYDDSSDNLLDDIII